MSHNQAICHNWIYAEDGDSYDFASYNISFYSNRLYSYSSVLAVIDRKRDIVTINKDIANYSNTSNRHYRHLRQAIPSNYTVFMNPHPDLQPLEGYLREIVNLLDKQTRARVSDYITPAITLINESMQWINIYKPDGRKTAYKELVKLSKQKDNLLIASEELIEKAKEYHLKAKAKADKKAQKRRQESLNKFLGHSLTTFDPNYGSVYLRVVDDVIKTSNGLQVPLRESLITYQRYKKGKPILGLKLGSYTVLKASKKEVLIGCTRISSEELNATLSKIFLTKEVK